MTSHYANPAPLGLMAFGMTTVLLNIHNAGFFPLNASIMAMGLFYGGLAQVIAGILEYKKNNTFGVTAFVSYGFFWITLVGLWVLPKMGMAEATSPAFMGWFLAAWGTFTGLMFVGTLKFNRVKQFIFASLTVLFFLLAIHNWTGSELIGHIAGWEGIVCGLSAIYLAMASVINEVHGKVMLPVGEPKSNAVVDFKPDMAEAA
ncbi:acetate uptake transporter [Neiella marina]|uniref:Acetate uptake transporter n=1 Tax=Neiella holothuriorum TaxID=2870530 RepID=A0ABS7EC13_9GAMM|nr:acetate uptake transporter [Neiella holothuriorum]MBW8189872.1 acetate uptake transporter [Neiella holothuriorum]